MNITEVYTALKENIDLETQNPLDVVATVYGVMGSIDPKTCVHTIKDGLGLYIHQVDDTWEPTEKKMFINNVAVALRENIDLETQNPLDVVTGLYEAMDFMESVTPVKSVNESLERYLRDNGISPEQMNMRNQPYSEKDVRGIMDIVGCTTGHIPDGYYLRKAQQ